jgi:oxygen-independent coproporphyrinogen-3 oxidase
LIGLGVSSIGNIGATYQQNAKTLDEYQGLLEQGRLPVVRGVALSKDDLLRRSIIMALMCQGVVVFDVIDSTHLIDFKYYFQNELLQLKDVQSQGIVNLDDKDIEVTETGWFVIRAIAMVFDLYLQGDQQRMRFSKKL